MYCIVDWDANYEVDRDGRSWKEGKDFFAGPLPYTRAPSRRDWPVRLLQIRELVGDEVHAIVGVFERLCGIVACEKRPQRVGGTIRNSRGEPASLHEIARMLLWSDEKTEWALGVLSHPEIQWITHDSQNGADNSETSEARTNKRDSKISATVKVISDQKSKSCSTTDTVKGPRILALHDEISQKGHDPRPDSRCFVALTEVLKPPDNDSYTSLANFTKWLAQQKRAGPERYKQVVVVAKDCVNGKCPMAVFMSRVKQQWGYQPPSRKRKYRS